MLIGGTGISMVNLLPLPWSLRLLWLRLLFFITVKGTLLFPSTLQFVTAQNEAYRMGKQQGESNQSFMRLEGVLQSVSLREIPVERVRDAFEQAEQRGVAPEQLARFMAQAIFDQETAEGVLSGSLQEMPY